MVSPLIGIHAFLGEAGVFAFIWAFVELLNPIPPRIKRAKIACLLGFIFFVASWAVGGYYYVDYYGTNVKPVILAGPQSWAHSVFLEAKEHMFMFLPFISLVVTGMLFQYHHLLLEHKRAKVALLALIGLIVLIGFSMAGMGYIVSSGARAALEAAA